MQVCVRDIMTDQLLTITSEDSVGQAAHIMNAQKIGCLPVLEDGSLVGIITSQNVRIHHKNRLVADAMSHPVITVELDTPIWEAAQIMEDHKIEHLVVTDRGQLKGLLTKGTLLSFLGLHRDHLTDLPRGSYGCYLLAKWLCQGKYASCIFIDLDNFGEINKRFGHISGDGVLRRTSKIIASVVALPASTCRYGGDEFLVVVPGDYTEACHLARKILKALDETSGLFEYAIGASAGITSIRFENGLSSNQATKVAEELIGQSSLAAMQAKMDGTKIRCAALAWA